MKEDKKFTFLLSGLYLIISALLVLKYYPYMELMDLLGLMWPLFGILAVIEFVRGDKWGWGGLLSVIFLFYCAFYFPIIVIINIITSSYSLDFVIDLCIAVIGPIQFIFYYD